MSRKTRPIRNDISMFMSIPVQAVLSIVETCPFGEVVLSPISLYLALCIVWSGEHDMLEVGKFGPAVGGRERKDCCTAVVSCHYINIDCSVWDGPSLAPSRRSWVTLSGWGVLKASVGFSYDRLARYDCEKRSDARNICLHRYCTLCSSKHLVELRFAPARRETSSWKMNASTDVWVGM